LKKPFDVTELPEVLKRQFEHEISEKTIIVETHISDNFQNIVDGDKFRLSHVLASLFGNAIKFSLVGGTVDIKLSTTESARDEETNDTGAWFYSKADLDEKDYLFYRFSISDHGKGLTQSKIETLFQPFILLQDGNLDGGRGAGVGLVVSKQIATLHGGTIVVKSKIGEGSTFTLVVPFLKADTEAVKKDFNERGASLSLALKSNLEVIFSPSTVAPIQSSAGSDKKVNTTAKSKAAPILGPSSGGKCSVLVVDGRHLVSYVCTTCCPFLHLLYFCRCIIQQKIIGDDSC
jgi:hypothetical protein